MKKRLVSFALAVIILIPLMPKPIESSGFVKEIDAIYNDFKLTVGGKNIPCKEAFIYNDELWVPLRDLGKALKLEVHFNLGKRFFKINSGGKLNIADSSKINTAYQKGYEVLAKDRMIEELDKEIRAFEGTERSNTSDREHIVRNISVGFSNINLYLDGKKVNLPIQPLIYKNDLYVSLVAISPYLYLTPMIRGNVVDIDANAVLLERPSHNSADSLISFRDNLNNRLDIQLAEMEKKKEILMDVRIPYQKINTLSAMRKYLNKHLGEISDFPVNVDFRAAMNSLYFVDISFDSKYNYKWRSLSKQEVEAYIWDIFVAINSLYNENARIQGSIKNPNYSSPSYSSTSKYENYVEFNTEAKDLIFNFVNSNLDMTGRVDPTFIEESLSERLNRYNWWHFDFKARISGYDLDLVVTPRSKDYMKGLTPASRLTFLREIDYEIRRYYPDLKVDGRIEYPGEYTIYFHIDKGKISSSN